MKPPVPRVGREYIKGCGRRKGRPINRSSRELWDLNRAAAVKVAVLAFTPLYSLQCLRDFESLLHSCSEDVSIAQFSRKRTLSMLLQAGVEIFQVISSVIVTVSGGILS